MNLRMIITVIVLLSVAGILHWSVEKNENSHPFFKDQRWNILQATLILVVVEIFISLNESIFKFFVGHKHTSVVILAVFVLCNVLYAPMLLTVLWLFFHFRLRQSFMVLGVSSHEWMGKTITGLKWGLLIPTCLFGVSFLLPTERVFHWLKETNSILNNYISYFGLPVTILLVVFRIVFISTLEEVVIRGIYYSALRRSIDSMPANLISSVVFMLLHGRINLGVLALGCICAYLYERFHSLIPPVTAHFMFNLFVYSLAGLV